MNKAINNYVVYVKQEGDKRFKPMDCKAFATVSTLLCASKFDQDQEEQLDLWLVELNKYYKGKMVFEKRGV